MLNSASRPQPSLQVSVRDCHYTTISIIQLSLTALEASFKQELSSSSLCLLQNQDHTELLFPFPPQLSLQVTEAFHLFSPVPPPIPSLLSFFPASSPYLLTLLGISSQNLSALMCSFIPSLPVWAWHHLFSPPNTLYFHYLKLFSSKTTQNPSEFVSVSCFRFVLQPVRAKDSC